jgi:hypothetical protein
VLSEHDHVRMLIRDRQGAIVGTTTISREDAALFGRYALHLKDTGYVALQTREYLHRLILGLGAGDKRQADHINGDKLDNRRSNLRIVTHGENKANMHGPYRCRNRSSKYRGVTRTPSGLQWVAVVWLRGERHSLGAYRTELEAAEVAAAFRREHMPTSEMDKQYTDVSQTN